jgi:hypothetical protein
MGKMRGFEGVATSCQPNYGNGRRGGADMSRRELAMIGRDKRRGGNAASWYYLSDNGSNGLI